jgi:hypothetical protein
MQSTLRRVNEPCVYVMESGRVAGRAYVGIAVDPAQRVRRHNGEIGGGAASTRSGRPWTILLVISGFPSQVSALQFEHALQHPSSAARLRAATLAAGGAREGGSPARGERVDERGFLGGPADVAARDAQLKTGAMVMVAAPGLTGADGLRGQLVWRCGAAGGAINGVV